MSLIEVLSALFVLAIGLASVMSIVTRSANMGDYASNRNNAAVLLPEAIADIERMSLITTELAAANGLDKSYVGELMETTSLGSGANAFNNVLFQYPQGPTGDATHPNSAFSYKQLAYVNGASASNLAYWPFSLQYSRVLGMFPPITVKANKRGSFSDNLSDITGPAYRALFKLEPHQDWFVLQVDGTRVENVDSAFVGVYVLTIAMYRDIEPQKSILDSKGKKLEQLTDPTVVYLRDKKVR